MIIIAGDMIDDWLDDRIIEPEEHGVVAEAVNPPPVERLAQRIWDLSRT